MEKIMVVNLNLENIEVTGDDKQKKIKINPNDKLVVSNYKLANVVKAESNSISFEKEKLEENKPVEDYKPTFDLEDTIAKDLDAPKEDILNNKFEMNKPVFEEFQETPIIKEFKEDEVVKDVVHQTYLYKVALVKEKSEKKINILDEKLKEVSVLLKETDEDIEKSKKEITELKKYIIGVTAIIDELNKVAEVTQTIDLKAIQNADASLGHSNAISSITSYESSIVKFKDDIKEKAEHIKLREIYKNELCVQEEKIFQQKQQILTDELKQCRGLLEKLNFERLEILKPMEKIQGALMDLKKKIAIKNNVVVTSKAIPDESQAKKVLSIKNSPFENLRTVSNEEKHPLNSEEDIANVEYFKKPESIKRAA